MDNKETLEFVLSELKSQCSQLLNTPFIAQTHKEDKILEIDLEYPINNHITEPIILPKE